MKNHYGIMYTYGDYWGTTVVKIIGVSIDINDSDLESVYVKWSDYHRDYVVVEEESDMEVLILPCLP